MNRGKDCNPRKFTAQIDKIGYIWHGHFGCGAINVKLSISGGGYCAFDLSANDDIRKFIALFPDVDFENDAYIDVLNGKCLNAWFDWNGNGRIRYVSNVLDEQGFKLVKV